MALQADHIFYWTRSILWTLKPDWHFYLKKFFFLLLFIATPYGKHLAYSRCNFPVSVIESCYTTRQFQRGIDVAVVVVRYSDFWEKKGKKKEYVNNFLQNRHEQLRCRISETGLLQEITSEFWEFINFLRIHFT